MKLAPSRGFTPYYQKPTFWICMMTALGLALGIIFNPMFALFGLIGLIFLFAFLLYPRVSLITLILLKPIVDLTWNYDLLPVPFDVAVGNVSFRYINLQKPYSIVIAFMAFVIAMRIKPWQEKWQRAVLWFVGMGFLSFLLARDMRGAPDMLKIMSGFIVILVSEEIFKSYKEFKVFFICLCVVMLAPYLMMFLQMAGIMPTFYTTAIEGEEVARITSGYNHPVDGFRYVFFLTLFGVFFFTVGFRHLASKIALVVLFALGVYGIYLSYFRMGLLVIFVPVVLYFILTRRGSLTLLVLASLGITLILTWTSVVQLYAETIEIIETGNIDPLFNWRGAIWKDHWAHFIYQPFLHSFLGSGMYTDLNQFVPPSFQLVTHNNAHNDYLRIVIEHGTIGLMIFIFMIVRMFQYFSNDAFSRDVPLAVRSLRILAPLALIGILMMSVTLRPTEEPSIMFYLAIAFSASRLDPLEDEHVRWR